MIQKISMSDKCPVPKDLATGVYVHIYDRIGIVNAIKKWLDILITMCKT